MAHARGKAHLARRMYLGAAALAFPAGAALALAVAHGSAVLSGGGGRSFVILAATGLAGVASAAVAAARERRQRDPPVPAAIEAVLAGISSALGDAALGFDASGRLVWANDEALALCGQPREALAGRSRDLLGEDLAVLLRGLGRGAATGRVVLATPTGKVAARAAAVRVSMRSSLDIVAVRVDAPAVAEAPRAVEDDDVIAIGPEPEAAAGRAPAERGPRLAAPALAAEVGAPVARASEAASLLRLALPAGNGAAGAQLARLEEALARAEERIALLANAPAAGEPRERVDLDALLSDALAGVGFAPGVRVRRASAPAPARGDPASLRLALRHVLRTAAAAMPAGGELVLRAGVRDGEAALEIADSGAAGGATVELATAEHLVAAQGGRLERVAIPGRGAICRVVLPADASPRPAASGAPFDSSMAPR